MDCLEFLQQIYKGILANVAESFRNYLFESDVKMNRFRQMDVKNLIPMSIWPQLSFASLYTLPFGNLYAPFYPR